MHTVAFGMCARFCRRGNSNEQAHVIGEAKGRGGGGGDHRLKPLLQWHDCDALGFHVIPAEDMPIRFAERDNESNGLYAVYI